MPNIGGRAGVLLLGLALLLVAACAGPAEPPRPAAEPVTATAVAEASSVQATTPAATPTLLPPPPSAIPIAASTAAPTVEVERPATPRPIPTASPQPSAAAERPAAPDPARASPSPLALASPSVPIAAPKARASLTEIAAVKTSRPVVALTFDAGGELGSTVRTLDALRSGGVRATFFVTGEFAASHPDVVKRIVGDGHELANHTYTHRDLTKLDDQAIQTELERTDETLRRLTGVSTTRPLMRLPYGSRDARVLRAVGAAGYRSIYWTLDVVDWRQGATPQSVATRVLNNTDPGDIVLHHCAEPATAGALPSILESLRGRGLSVVTVSDLLRDE